MQSRYVQRPQSQESWGVGTTLLETCRAVACHELIAGHLACTCGAFDEGSPMSVYEMAIWPVSVAYFPQCHI